jgi:hypothetical protein
MRQLHRTTPCLLHPGGHRRAWRPKAWGLDCDRRHGKCWELGTEKKEGQRQWKMARKYRRNQVLPRAVELIEAGTFLARNGVPWHIHLYRLFSTWNECTVGSCCRVLIHLINVICYSSVVPLDKVIVFFLVRLTLKNERNTLLRNVWKHYLNDAASYSRTTESCVP